MRTTKNKRQDVWLILQRNLVDGALGEIFQPRPVFPNQSRQRCSSLNWLRSAFLPFTQGFTHISLYCSFHKCLSGSNGCKIVDQSQPCQGCLFLQELGSSYCASERLKTFRNGFASRPDDVIKLDRVCYYCSLCTRSGPDWSTY